MNKYDFNEIEKELKKELKNTKTILTFGTIGSKNTLRDIDIIITKKKNAKLSKFYYEVHTLFDKINLYIKKRYHGRLIRFSAMTHEEEIKSLSKYNIKKDLLFHVMTYISLNQITRHWTPNLEDPKDAIRELKKDYECMKGDKKDLFNKNKFPLKGKNEAWLLYVNDLDRINSNIKNKTRFNTLNFLYDTMLRKKLKIKTKQAKNEKELRKIFYEMCNLLD